MEETKTFGSGEFKIIINNNTPLKKYVYDEIQINNLPNHLKNHLSLYFDYIKRYQSGYCREESKKILPDNKTSGTYNENIFLNPLKIVNIAELFYSIGWVVIPLGYDKGRPPKNWPSFDKNEGIRNVRVRANDNIRSLYNIAIQTGEKSNIFVVDIDLDKDGMGWWIDYCLNYGEPETFCVKTGSGGLHYYFNYDKDIKNSNRVISINKHSIGIDVKSDGGFVLSPGSVHPKNGNRYKIIENSCYDRNNRNVTIKNIPDKLKSFLPKKSEIKLRKFSLDIKKNYPSSNDEIYDSGILINDDAVIEILQFLPDDLEYDDYRNVLFSIHNHYSNNKPNGLGDINLGERRAFEFSSKSDKYVERFDRTWKYIKDNNQMSIGTLLYYFKKYLSLTDDGLNKYNRFIEKYRHIYDNEKSSSNNQKISNLTKSIISKLPTDLVDKGTIIHNGELNSIKNTSKQIIKIKLANMNNNDSSSSNEINLYKEYFRYITLINRRGDSYEQEAFYINPVVYDIEKVRSNICYHIASSNKKIPDDLLYYGEDLYMKYIDKGNEGVCKYLYDHHLKDDLYYCDEESCWFLYNPNTCLWEVDNSSNTGYPTICAKFRDVFYPFICDLIQSINDLIRLFRFKISILSNKNSNNNSITRIIESYQNRISRLEGQVKRCFCIKDTLHNNGVFSIVKNASGVFSDKPKDRWVQYKIPSDNYEDDDYEEYIECIRFSHIVDMTTGFLPIADKKVVDFRNKKVIDRKREHYFTNECNVTFDPNTHKKGLYKFMSNIMLESNDHEGTKRVKYLQRHLGACLTGDSSYQQFIVFYNSLGSNGKSTLLSMLSALLGSYCVTVAPSVITMTKDSNSVANPALLALHRKRLAILSEPPPSDIDKGCIFDVNAIKRIKGGDKLVGRSLYSNNMKEFVAICGLILACNKIPQFPSDDGGFQRRFEPFPFNARFVEAEFLDPNNPNERPIHNKLNNIIKHKYFLSTFLNWLMEGAYDFYNNPLNKKDIPTDIILLKKEQTDENDPLSEFLNEYYVIGDKSKSLTLIKIWEDYNNWFASLSENEKLSKKNSRISGKNKLSTRLSSRCGLLKHNDRGAVIFKGISYKDCVFDTNDNNKDLQKFLS